MLRDTESKAFHFCLVQFFVNMYLDKYAHTEILI